MANPRNVINPRTSVNVTINTPLASAGSMPRRLSKKGIETIGPSIINFANFEGLQAHAKSVEKRIRRK